MIGWEAGTETPIRRSRVPPPTFPLNNLNNLAWHNAENFGEIRRHGRQLARGRRVENTDLMGVDEVQWAGQPGDRSADSLPHQVCE
jgi:hypothetical protein